MAGFITVRGAREHNLKNIDVAMGCWFPSAASPTVMVKCIPNV